MSPKLKLNDETTYQLSLGGDGKTGEGRILNKLVGMVFVFLAITPLIYFLKDKGTCKSMDICELLVLYF